MTIGTFDFNDAFRELTGHTHFPWQRRLFDDWLARGRLPPAVDIPTGLGKTAVMAIWLLARAAGAALPRRLVYVVDRRTVVDQATECAELIRDALHGAERLEPVRRGLCLDGRPLAISTLRGRYVDNREWMADPAAPAIVIGTVDMVGSRLLFEGYGLSQRMRPYAAGLMGCDSLVMLDEAHLAHPFERLLRTIEREQRPSSVSGPQPSAGFLAGSAASRTLPPPFCVLPLSATMVQDERSGHFGIVDADWRDRTVRMRLEANKVLSIEDLHNGSDLHQVLADRAWCLMKEATAPEAEPSRIVIYCDRRRDAEKTADGLRKLAKAEKYEAAVILFVGGRRVREREQAAEEMKAHGLITSGAERVAPVFVVATSAGEVGVDLNADHMVCDLVPWERMVQRLGRVNRRGRGQARVLVIDAGSSDEKTTDKDVPDRLKATRTLVESLPRDDAGQLQAAPAALLSLRGHPDDRDRVSAASTDPPLYPALTRPLVEAWSMTSLHDHTGRPEVGPWLRGWVKDEPQTIVVWRQYLPVFFARSGLEVRQQPGREVAAFFGAAPPHTEEFLETETRRVVEWLRKRARKVLNRLEGESSSSPSDDDGADNGDPPNSDGAPIAPLRPGAPVAFLLDRASRPAGDLTLSAITGHRTQELYRRFAGQQVVVDARLGGLKDGLLHDGSDDAVSTIDNNWNSPECKDPQRPGPPIRVRTLTEPERDRTLSEPQTPERGAEHPEHPWRETLAIPYCSSPEGDAAATWLVVEHWRDNDNGEEARAISAKAQRLDEHQAWAADEAARLADAIGLDECDRAMLMVAARHHDDGKRAPRWQRAFNARHEGGPYAKTAGPFNRHVLNGYRHELKSALDAETNGLDGIDRSELRFEMALHLIASHHGHARPAIGVDGYDDLPPSAAANRAHEIALRFARLQRQWGPWGLAWWEALMRAADQRASRALEELATRERAQPLPQSRLRRPMFQADKELAR